MLVGNNCLSIDPGEDAGAAILADGYKLQACGLVQKRGKHVCEGIDPWVWLAENKLEAFDFLVIEIPRISKQTKNAAAIVTLSVTAGRLIERYPHKELVLTFVEQWKGNVEKHEHNARVLEVLYDTERALLPSVAPGILHNVIDGIGIGLRATGRMLRGKARGR
jgi:hypothetical protein